MKFQFKILLLFMVHGLAILGVGIYQIQTLYESQESAFKERLFIESTIVQRRFETVLDTLNKTVDILQNAQEISTGMLSHDVDLLHRWGKLFIPKYADTIQFITEKGVVIARGEAEFRFGDTLEHAVYFQKAFDHTTFMGIDTMDATPMLIVARRIKNNISTPQGVIAVAVKLNDELLNNLVLGTHYGINFYEKTTDTMKEIAHTVIPLHQSLDKGKDDIRLYVQLASHSELDAITTTRTNLLIGFLALFIPFGILIHGIIFRYLKHYNTFMELLFDFYETKISVESFTHTVKNMMTEKTSSEVKKISALFLKIVQKMNENQMHFLELSHTDALTTLSNRRRLDDLLEIKLKEASRGLSLSIILIDIDMFKKINDTYGHDTGDAVLQQFSLILKHSIRQTDSVGRWGGEEFLMILPMTNNQGALELANAVQEKIQAFRFILDIPLTASLGIATYRANDTERSLCKRADDALYRAKHLGRNRVENETV